MTAPRVEEEGEGTWEELARKGVNEDRCAEKGQRSKRAEFNEVEEGERGNASPNPTLHYPPVELRAASPELTIVVYLRAIRS